MSELLAPLDVARYISQEAAELDTYMGEFADPESSEYKELQQRRRELDSMHPYIYDQVTVHGDIISTLMDDDGYYPLALPDSEKTWSSVTGEYWGLELRSYYNQLTGTTETRYLHAIKLDEIKRWDEWGHRQTSEVFQYVHPQSARVIPVAPLNAHSMADLRGDDVVELFDEVAFDETVNQLTRLKQIGRIAHEMFTKRAGQISLNQQRISYLNSLYVLDGQGGIASKEYAFADTREKYIDNVDVTYSGGNICAVVLEPEFFDIAPSTYRHKNGTVQRSPLTELVVVSRVSAEESVYIPASKIIGVRPPS